LAQRGNSFSGLEAENEREDRKAKRKSPPTKNKRRRMRQEISTKKRNPQKIPRNKKRNIAAGSCDLDASWQELANKGVGALKNRFTRCGEKKKKKKEGAPQLLRWLVGKNLGGTGKAAEKRGTGHTGKRQVERRKEWRKLTGEKSSTDLGRERYELFLGENIKPKVGW